MRIATFFKTQTVFLTGITGFIGKVLLARLLNVAEPKKIYVLLRWKNQPPHQRLQKTLDSECFDSVRAAKNMTKEEFLVWANTKVFVLEGDMQKNKLNLSAGDLEKVAKEVTVIIHNAANVRFEDVLLNSIRSNVFGSLELLDIAKTCKNLVSYIHISTAYTNCNIKETDSEGKIHIEEKLYPLNFDGEEVYKKLLSSTSLSRTQEKQFLSGHANVYTFSKNLSEHLIMQRRGNLPVAIVRPSMVGVAYRTPMPGWYDNASAVGGLVLLSGLGIIRYFPDLKDGIIDQIPVDYVVDTYLATAMYRAQQPCGPDTKPMIVHSTSSHLNPCKMRRAMEICMVYWKKQEPGKIPHSLRKPGIIELPIGVYPRVILDTLPWKLAHGVSKLIPSKRLRKMTTLLDKAADRARIASYYFQGFMSNTWVHENDTLLAIKASLCPADRQTFSLDPQDICWDYFMKLFCYAIHHHILKADCEPPPDETSEPMDGSQSKVDLESVSTLPFPSPNPSPQPRIWSKM